MLRFKTFVETTESEEDENILHTLSKIPKSHAALVKGYTFKLQGGNTLKGDDDNIGYVQDDPKEIVVAAPWNYSREMTFLHEIAHRVYDKLSNDLKRQWAMILAKTPNRQHQSADEMFCMAYAATYAKHPPVIHYHPEWIDFINRLPQ